MGRSSNTSSAPRPILQRLARAVALIAICVAPSATLQAGIASAQAPKPPAKSDKKDEKSEAKDKARTPKAPVPKRAKPGAEAGKAEPGDTPVAKEYEEVVGLDYKPTSPATRVTFNLEDADLPDLVRLISQITGKRFILPGKARSIKATVYAPTRVTAAEAYQAFLSILELNGMALVPAGRYLKIVESGRVEGRAIPLYTEGTVPSGDRFVTRLQNVNHIPAEDAAKLLERFKSGDGSLTTYAPTNLLIITDTGTNLRRMMRILDVIDVARTGEQIWVEPVFHANAAELAQRLTEIFEPTQVPAPKKAAKPAPAPKKGKTAPPAPGTTHIGSASGESRLTKILADERTNSLIILATERAYLRILEMLKYLDVSMEGEGGIHVHYLQHSDSEEIASTLQSLVGGRSGAKTKGKAAEPETAVFEGKVGVTAHKASNALVITSSTHDYAALRHVIDKLDSRRKQVFIEAVIMELSVDRSSSFGVGWHGGIPDLPTEDSLAVLGFRAGTTIGGLKGLALDGNTLSGLAVGVQGPEVEGSSQLGLGLPGFGVAITAMASSGDANILSTPHLIATDNVEAEISVGQNVPLQTSSSLGSTSNLASLLGSQSGSNSQQGIAALGALGGLGGFGGSVPRQDVGTTITLTPHINETNEIRLEISEEISSAGAPSEAGDLGVVSIDRTRAKTEVVVRDQQTVVIGGLMRDQLTNAESKVPILGDIPLLGALFRDTHKRKVKKNLLLFLTPYIIRSPDDLRSIYERKMRERQEFLDRYFVFGDPDYEPPIDYSRTRGLVSEILLELDSLSEKRKLVAELASRPEPSHEARDAVGEAETQSNDSEDAEDDGVVIDEHGEEGEGDAAQGATPAAPETEAPETGAPPAPPEPDEAE